MTTANRFEDRLLHELLAIVAARPAPASVTSRRPRWGRLALAGAGVAAALAGVVVLASGGDVASRAYALQARPDGTVTVSIEKLSDADGLERSLRAAGVPAVVDYTHTDERGCPDSGPHEGGGTRPGATDHGDPGHATGDASKTGVHSEGATDRGASQSVSGSSGAGGASTATVESLRHRSDSVTFTIDPGELKAGQRVFITTSAGTVSSISVAISKRRPARPCPPASTTR